MKTFREYLTEAQMTSIEALKVFGYGSSSSFDANELKSKYKQLAVANHPDRGGDLDKMKQINVAYDILGKMAAGEREYESRQQSREDRKAKEKAFQNIATASVESQLDVNAFLRHFESIFGETFRCNKLVRPVSNSVLFNLEFVNATSTTVLELSISADYLSLYGTASLATDGVGMRMLITTEILFNRRKVKLTQSSYTVTSQLNVLSDPEQIFPTAKLKTQTAKVKSRKFAKRDALLTIEKELGAEYRNSDGGWFYIPVGEYTVLIYRMTMMGSAAWGFNGLYLKHSRVTMLPVVTLIEDEASINWFVDEMKHIQTLSSQAEIVAAITKLVADYKTRPRV